MVTEEAVHRLATYGSLAPGQSNHHQLDGLDGRWSEGHVYGTLIDGGWGAGLGYPALVLDPDGPPVAVQIFESMDLPDHWSRLDDFEGAGYQRVVTNVRTSAGDLRAYIYASGRNPESASCALSVRLRPLYPAQTHRKGAKR